MPALSPELVSLVHHVQLNQEGWWDRAMERLVLFTVWLTPHALTEAAVGEAIRTYYSVVLEPDQVARQLSKLRSKRELVVIGSGILKVSEAKLAELEKDKKDCESMETAIQQRFIRELETAKITGDLLALWGLFFEHWLKPTVCSLGARTYELIAGNYHDWMGATDLNVFLQNVPSDQHIAVREAISRFLDPKDTVVRGYLLRLMDAYFVVEASRLSDATLRELEKMAASHPSFTLFIDTNVILSILGLHGEVKKEAAGLLIKLPQVLSGRVDVRMYVLPKTIEETRSAIEHELDGLRSLRLNVPLAKAVLSTGGLGDVPTAYAEAVVKAGRPITPEEFLNPYSGNLIALLQAKGIKLHNASVGHLERRADVVRDVDTQERFEKKRFKERAKSRGRILHDTVLWYVAKEKRPPEVESPTDAQYWVVTEDFRLIGFDAHKNDRDGIPVCVQPLVLVQIFQFWSGRTEGIEQALLGGLRLSLLSPEFDPKTEDMTLTILRTLSRFERVDDLSSETISQILVNDALRHKLIKTKSEDAQIALIREEIISEYRKVSEELEAAKTEAETLSAKNAQLSEAHRAESEAKAASDQLVNEKGKQLREASEMVANQNAQLITYKDRLSRGAERERDLEKRLTQIEEKLTLDAEERERQETRRNYSIVWLVLPALGLALVLIGARELPPNSLLGNWRVEGLLLVLYATLWLLGGTSVAKRSKYLESWRVISRISTLRRRLLGFLGAIVLGLIVNTLYEFWLKPLQASYSTSPATPNKPGPKP